MNWEIFICCFFLGFVGTQLIRFLWANRTPRCQKGKPCGCQQVRNGFIMLKYCEDKPEEKR